MKVESISNYRKFSRNLNPREMLGEITNLINADEYEDFIFIADGEKRRCVRIGSHDADLRIGDLLYLLEVAKADLMKLE